MVMNMCQATLSNKSHRFGSMRLTFDILDCGNVSVMLCLDLKPKRQPQSLTNQFILNYICSGAQLIDIVPEVVKVLISTEYTHPN